DIDSPMGYVEYMLNSRLKELSETAMLKQDIQGDFSLEMDNIIDAVIAKYSKSTGTVATFLVKDTAINELIKICTLEEAEEGWKKNEEFVMDSIY
ncbi:initiator RepB protein, partial [Bacillus thuringiensis]